MEHRDVDHVSSNSPVQIDENIIFCSDSFPCLMCLFGCQFFHSNDDCSASAWTDIDFFPLFYASDRLKIGRLRDTHIFWIRFNCVGVSTAAIIVNWIRQIQWRKKIKCFWMFVGTRIRDYFPLSSMKRFLFYLIFECVSRTPSNNKQKFREATEE